MQTKNKIISSKRILLVICALNSGHYKPDKNRASWNKNDYPNLLDRFQKLWVVLKGGMKALYREDGVFVRAMWVRVGPIAMGPL